MSIVHGLSRVYGERIDFRRVNIHNPDNQELIEAYGFNTAPELYLLDRQGKIAARWDDLVTADELTQAFERILNE